ncbi:MAG: hypothetical protein AAFR81_22270 [Chloroflexota bacterium]
MTRAGIVGVGERKMMVDRKPNIIERMLVNCIPYGFIFGSLYGLIVFLISVSSSVFGMDNLIVNATFLVIGLLLFIFIGGVVGVTLAWLLVLYWSGALTLVERLVDYRRRPQFFTVASSAMIVLQAIGFIQFFYTSDAPLIELFLMRILPMTLATCAGLYALHQYIRQLDDYYQRQDPRKEKPKRTLTTTHPLALEDEVSQPEVYEEAVREQEVRKL